MEHSLYLFHNTDFIKDFLVEKLNARQTSFQ
jgi:hypothetical protein